MPDIILQDINPRIQIIAAGGQTVFAYPFPIYANTDLIVYQRAAADAVNDLTQVLVYVTDYIVTNNAAPAVGGTITLNIGATAGDIITIIRNMPENRLVNYLDGGLWSATQFNTDFDRTVMMAQTNTMFERTLAPHYNTNDVINTNSNALSSGVDNYLPVLPANCVWMKNNANTAIVAVTSFTGGAGTIVLPTVAGKIAYFTNTTGNLASSIFTTPPVDGNLGDSITTDGAGNQRVATIPGKNMIVNGSFQVAQRGAGGAAIFAVPAATTQYTLDRWQIVTQANQASTITQAAGATSGSFLVRIQRNAGQAGTGQMIFATTLTRDMCIGAAGRAVTISFKARHGANFSTLSNSINVQVYSGTGNTDASVFTPFTGSVAEITSNTNLTANLTNYSYTTGVLGANVTQLAVEFVMTPTGVAGAADYYEITDVQLEISPNQTAFDRKPFSKVLQECLPFYAKSFTYATAPAQNVGLLTGEQFWPATNPGASLSYSGSILFTLPMRASPVGRIVTYSPAAATAQAYDETAGGPCTNTVVGVVSEKQFGVSATGNAGTIVSSFIGIHWTADIDLV